MVGFLSIDARAFRDGFDRQPFTVAHGLAGHPLFALPRLVELARALPENQVEYNAADVPVSLDPQLAPRTGLSPEETVRRIEECNSWLVLKNVERDPEYGQLLERCLEEVRAHSEAVAPGMRLAEAFVFVSSPGSVTPFHIDPEHNFLLQIRGSKTLYVFDPADREIVSEQDLERFYAGSHRNLAFQGGWQRRATACELAPGNGVHVPVTAPHWVKNGDAVSVSFSITFRSRRSERRAQVYCMNAQLRRCGLQPAPFGASALRDSLKQWTLRAIRRAGAMARWNHRRRQRAARGAAKLPAT